MMLRDLSDLVQVGEKSSAPLEGSILQSEGGYMQVTEVSPKPHSLLIPNFQVPQVP